jgi:hypothetical protein
MCKKLLERSREACVLLPRRDCRVVCGGVGLFDPGIGCYIFM